jgi:nicotinate-nucleotide pyrophosphorylase (carboxylating)
LESREFSFQGRHDDGASGTRPICIADSRGVLSMNGMPSSRQFPDVSDHDPVALALAEDVGAGDVTCEYFVGAGQRGMARIFAKQACVLAGVETSAHAFEVVDPATEVRCLRKDGESLAVGDPVLEATGTVRSLLTAERTALNFIQRLSGVATMTRKFVDAVKPHPARILDTRKTTPGLRRLEKAAVVAGGGTNHRIGLYDMAMVKENHYAADASLPHLREAIVRFRAERPGVRLEIEAQSLDQVRDFLTLEGVDVIMLDNLSVADMTEAVRMRGAKAVSFEASGGVNLATVNAIAATGVDFISVGAITHSAPAVDFSLDLLRGPVPES